MRIQYDPPLPDRTKVLQIANKIRNAAARELPWSAYEAWSAAQEDGTEMADAVWFTLTTPQRDFIREVQNMEKANR